MGTDDEVKFSFIVVSNRLPVDQEQRPDGSVGWRVSPGGLVSALEPVMLASGGAWVGWAGTPDLDLPPFEHHGMHLVGVPLSEQEIELYYEGFSNDTLWPLYHDVIAPPSYNREWWQAYRLVNQRFADRVAAHAAEGATVWVHDYQLQLVPAMLRALRPDLVIGFFNHIPFPPYGLFAQLPWRRRILEGILGADVIGFQRATDAANFGNAVRRLIGWNLRRGRIALPEMHSDAGSSPARTVVAREFPISIDAARIRSIAERPDVRQRSRRIREELGNPSKILFGVDRLDYTKGIRHRLKAYGELLHDGTVDPADTVLIQVASPSRENVENYRILRDEIELIVGRINGDFSGIGHPAVSYLHHRYPLEEMVALYLAADVMLVTALRDGMNLVAKEYVAARIDDDGVLVLSEFAGAADELKQALLVNPHDIEGLKETILAALHMPKRLRSTRMRALRRRVSEYDVHRWSAEFLGELAKVRSP